MTAVIDASTAVAYVVGSGAVARWAEAALVVANPLVGPELVFAESANILRRLQIGGNISSTQATTAYRDLLRLDFELYPFRIFAERIWALRANIVPYDAWYVAIAESLGCPLYTMDRRLARAPGPICQIIVPPLEMDD